MSSDITRSRALLFLILASLLWSSGGVLIKLVDWNPMAIAGARSMISAITLMILCGVPKPPFTKLQLLAALAYATTVVTFVIANKLTTAANAILLQYTSPIWVAILAPSILKERTTRSDCFIIAAVTVGLSLFFLDQLSPGNIVGNIVAIGSGIAFALLAICLRLQRGQGGTQAVVLGNLLAAGIGIPFMFDGSPTSTGLLGIVLLGVFQLGISYFLFTKAFSQVSALEAMIVPMLEPLLNPVWVFLMIGEKPGFWALVGGLIVLFAIVCKGWLGLHSSRPQASTI